MFGGDPLSDESNQATLIIGVGYQPLSIIEIVRETRFSLGPRKTLSAVSVNTPRLYQELEVCRAT